MLYAEDMGTVGPFRSLGGLDAHASAPVRAFNLGGRTHWTQIWSVLSRPIPDRAWARLQRGDAKKRHSARCRRGRCINAFKKERPKPPAPRLRRAAAIGAFHPAASTSRMLSTSARAVRGSPRTRAHGAGHDAGRRAWIARATASEHLSPHACLRSTRHPPSDARRLQLRAAQAPYPCRRSSG